MPHGHSRSRGHVDALDALHAWISYGILRGTCSIRGTRTAGGRFSGVTGILGSKPLGPSETVCWSYRKVYGRDYGAFRADPLLLCAQNSEIFGDTSHS